MATQASPQAAALIDQLANLGTAFKNGQAGSREGLLGICSQLISELSHPSESMLRLLWAEPCHHSIIRVGIDIKLFEALASGNGEGQKSEVLASKCEPQAEPLLVARMLRHLAAMGTVRETGPDTFAPTAFSNTFAEEAYRDANLFIEDNFQPVHVNLPAYFKDNGYKLPTTGVDSPFQYTYNCKGQHMFEYFQGSAPLMGKRFASMMDAWSKGRPRWFQEGYYPVHERLVAGAKAGEGEVLLVDVGGGSGHDIDSLQTQLGDSAVGKLVLQDRPEIIELAQVAPDIEKMPHDFLTEQPVKGARAYYMHSIIQDWNDEVNTQILKSLVPAMTPGYSKILVNDFVLPDQHAVWPQTCLDWELMASLGARHRTEAEHRALYEGAGLKLVGIWSHPQSLDSLLEIELA